MSTRSLIPIKVAGVFNLVYLLIAVLVVNANAYAIGDDFERCEKVVKNWAQSSLDHEVREDRNTLRDLLFFLHVPRTGGRTYFHCFLKKLYPSSLECPRSYDKLRFNPSKANCRLLVTHDDYSVMSKFPRERTSVVTILRDPVDRVFSTYEFSVEVAARFLIHPNLTSATQMARRLRAKTKGVSTLEIWPWKYLVPWMREDLFARRDARYHHKGPINAEMNNLHNMEDFVMPLHEYINHPVAEDIVHNGATFQVAGLTNNSYLAESHEVRHCVIKYRTLGQHVVQVAKKRLDDMLYVGLTEEHRESATMFANVVGAQVISQLRAPKSGVHGVVEKTEQRSFSDLKPNNNERQSGTLHPQVNETAPAGNGEAADSNMTVEELMEAYEGCISSLRNAQAGRRASSLKRISPVNFSKEARLKVSEGILQEIRSLNDLDFELYEYARDIFLRQHKTKMNRFTMEMWENMLRSSYSSMSLWNGLSLAVPFVLVPIFFLVFVNARRRTSFKVKM